MNQGHEAVETATQKLHRLTSYIPEREWDVPVDDPQVRQDFAPNDFDRHAALVKTYDRELARTASRPPRRADGGPPGHPARVGVEERLLSEERFRSNP